MTLFSAAGLTLGEVHAQDAAFTGIRAEFDHLADWAGAPALVNPSTDTISVRGSQTELMTTTWGGAHLTLRSGAIGGVGRSSVHLDRWCDFSAEPESAQEWRELLETYLRPFQDLLVLSVGRSIGMHGLMLRPDGCEALCDAFLVTTPVAAGSTEPISHFNAPTLLRAATSPIPLAELLPRWIDLREELWGVLVALLAPFTYAEHQFQALVQSAEAYHHARKGKFGTAQLPRADQNKRVEQVVAALEQPSLDAATTQRARSVIQTRNAKPMREKLRDVVSATGALGEEIADWAPDFVQNLTQTCNKVSHGSATPQHVLSAEERHWHGQVLLGVMRVRLLQELGCADAGLRALENRSFQFALEQLIGERP
ncbi:HEPN domain-containing protein [Streptomyces sp. WI03-4A]|uniref:HEPN domain-containing protein n=1 Tax=Streptomyces sp. WI03-4A TaxID=3028706 RepID=UPI0029C0FC77|nr:HEPN domain-containing protein [Streptomyces sp. WI03-4A]